MTADELHAFLLKLIPNVRAAFLLKGVSLTPLAHKFGINMKWTSLISGVVEQKCFTDTQVNGPYKYWHHKHIFKKISGGIKIIDKVNYAIPFGLIGGIFHPILVKNKLSK